MRYALVMLLLIAFTAPIFAQPKDDGGRLRQLKMYEDSLKSLGSKFINKQEETERQNANYTFIRTLVSALKISNSFQYKFDSVKSVTILNAPDEHFRVFTWQVANTDGSFRFYGAIQMNSPELKLIPLEDYSPLLKNPEDSVTSNRKWYGARYYKILQVTTSATPYYVLLGWKGNTVKSTKKVIETLSFKNDVPYFGLPVFYGNGKTRDRVVFEYTAQATMMLRYVPEQHLIIFDHLAPSQARYQNHPETYGPDMTYSGYLLKGDRWIYQDNLDMKNMPGALDAAPYTDPKKQAAIDAASAGKRGGSY